jgi:hypothetical protein
MYGMVQGVIMAAELGSGTRFKQLESKLEKKGAKTSAALAAWIGKNKYGQKKMTQMSRKGKK